MILCAYGGFIVRASDGVLGLGVIYKMEDGIFGALWDLFGYNEELGWSIAAFTNDPTYLSVMRGFVLFAVRAS